MKKSTKIICLCLILIICASFAIYHFNYSSNSVKAGNTYFTLPEGYSEIGSRDSFTNITNGVTPLNIRAYDSNDVMSYVDKYSAMKDEANVSVEQSEFNVDNVKVYRSTLGNDKTICHYWFLNDDNRVYEIWTSDANSDTDSVVKDLVGSMRTFIF